jgi:hypothetical protein
MSFQVELYNDEKSIMCVVIPFHVTGYENKNDDAQHTCSQVYIWGRKAIHCKVLN